MAPGRSLKIMLAIGLTAALVSGCHRRGTHDEDAPSGNMVITANPPKAEPLPRAVEGNTAPNMTPPKPISNDGAFGPDYAAPTAARPDAAASTDKPPAHEKIGPPEPIGPPEKTPANSQSEH